MERSLQQLTRDRRLLRLAGLIVSVGLVAGCQVPPKAPPASAPAAPPPEIEAAPPPPPPTPPPPSPAGPAAQQQAQKAAIAAAEQFELGNEENARNELKRALTLDYQNKLALNLSRQMSADPIMTLGKDFFPYTVRPGETLSKIAGRFLNDIYQFVILARYNNIAVPKQVSSGQVLRIPGKVPHGGTSAPPPPASPPTATSGGKSTTAVATTEPPSVRPPPPATLPPPPAPPPPPPEPTPGEKAMRSAQAAERNGELEKARLAYISAAGLGETGATPKIEQMTRALVQRYSAAARGALARQDLNGSITNWQRVLEIDPNNGTARSELDRMQALKIKLGGVK